MDLPSSLCQAIQPDGQQAQNKVNTGKLAPGSLLNILLGFLRGETDGLWTLAWGLLAFPHVGRGQPSSWGRNPPLSGLSSGILGLLIWGKFLKPDADYGLNPGSATILLGDLGQVTPPRASVLSLNGGKAALPHA